MENANKIFRHFQENQPNQVIEELKKSFQQNQAQTLINLHEKLDELWNKKSGIIFNPLIQLLKETQVNDFKLFNKLGNLARKEKKYNAANDCYRLALRINKNFEYAAYNLAASIVKEDIYDNEIREMILDNIIFNHFILPDPIEIYDEDIILNTLKILISVIKKVKDNEMIELGKNKTLSPSEFQRQSQIIDYKFAENLPDKINSREAYNILKIILLSEWDGLSQDDKKLLKVPLYNLSIQSLSLLDLNLTQMAMQRLEELKADFPYLLMMKSVMDYHQGLLNEAIYELNQLAKVHPEDRFIVINLGLAYKKSGNRIAAARFLIQGAQMIKDLEGYYLISDIINLADSYYKEERLEKALRLYKLAAKEVDNVIVLGNLGSIYYLKQDYMSAKDCFKKLLELTPRSTMAKKKLREIHDLYIQKAEEHSGKNQNHAAVKCYDEALQIIRTSSTLKKLTDLCKVLKDNKKSFEYMAQYRVMLEEEKTIMLESQRLELIKQGKDKLSKRDFNYAIKSFKEAFSIKLDKEVFMYLAHIYKSLNRQKALMDLINSWRIRSDMVSHVEE